MAGLLNINYHSSHLILNEFLNLWTLERVKNMNLEDYTNVGNQDTFCYWLEFKTEILGRIGGRPSNKFGIWKRKSTNIKEYNQFFFDDTYVWYKKYGQTADNAFENIKYLIIKTIKCSISKKFDKIDKIDLDSLIRWKIAFIYSDFGLMPIYKKSIIREIANIFEYDNYEKESLSTLHSYIVSQKTEEEDFFQFSERLYQAATKQVNRNYYIIGSKYSNENGDDIVDISKIMYEKEVISTGFFWGTDFSNLVGKGHSSAIRWIEKNIDASKYKKYKTAKRTLCHFLNIKSGDLIAVKSHGRYGDLTIIAYAEVVEDFEYNFNDDDLGHTIKVRFLEKNLKINTKLSYGQTIHKITPFEKHEHFEKIFGAYAIEYELSEDDNEVFNDMIDNEVGEDRINEKQTSDYIRIISSSQLVTRVHNKIQNEYAFKLKEKYPKDSIRTEHNYIDIKRENNNEIHLYEVKPYMSVYSCIRAGIGQLIDYSFKIKNNRKKIYLYIVGAGQPSNSDENFIGYLKNILTIDFKYLNYNE